MQGWNVINISSLNINDTLLHYVFLHILSSRANNFSQLLHLEILITWIMAHYNMDLSINAFVQLRWSYYFDRKILNKLNVIQVNGVWQHGMVNHVGNPTSTREEDNLLYISGCKPHLMSQFYGVESGLKSTL